MTILPEGTDFNTVVKYGNYSIKNGVNTPDSVNHSWYNLIVFPIGNDPAYIHQIAMPLGTSTIYVRNRNGGNYSNWSKNVTENISN